MSAVKRASSPLSLLADSAATFRQCCIFHRGFGAGVQGCYRPAPDRASDRWWNRRKKDRPERRCHFPNSCSIIARAAAPEILHPETCRLPRRESLLVGFERGLVAMQLIERDGAEIEIARYLFAEVANTIESGQSIVILVSQESERKAEFIERGHRIGPQRQLPPEIRDWPPETALDRATSVHTPCGDRSWNHPRQPRVLAAQAPCLSGWSAGRHRSAPCGCW